MRLLYALLTYSVLPFILLRLWLKSGRHSHFAAHWTEWLGFGPQPFTVSPLWIHAASMGEAQIAVAFTKRLRAQFPKLSILLTHTTATAAKQIQMNSLGAQVKRRYMPLDIPFAIRRFLNTVRPRALLLIETELWPYCLYLCYRRRIPVVLVNARLSERSARRYRRFTGSLIRQMLNQLSCVLAQTQSDAEHFLELGLAADRIHVMGNIKYDLEVPAQLLSAGQTLRETWGGLQRPVWIAASTHLGEAVPLLQAYAEVRLALPNSLLIWVPRHLETVAAIKAHCFAQGYRVACRSDAVLAASFLEIDIFIGDTMGELLLYYAASDLAFIGGSLVPKGGQNPIEAAILELPVLFGPHTFNFTQITEQLIQCRGAIRITQAHQLALQLISLLKDKNQRQQIGQAAQQCVAQNQGALHRQMVHIETLLNHVLSA